MPAAAYDSISPADDQYHGPSPTLLPPAARERTDPRTNGPYGLRGKGKAERFQQTHRRWLRAQPKPRHGVDDGQAVVAAMFVLGEWSFHAMVAGISGIR